MLTCGINHYVVREIVVTEIKTILSKRQFFCALNILLTSVIKLHV